MRFPGNPWAKAPGAKNLQVKLGCSILQAQYAFSDHVYNRECSPSRRAEQLQGDIHFQAYQLETECWLLRSTKRWRKHWLIEAVKDRKTVSSWYEVDKLEIEYRLGVVLLSSNSLLYTWSEKTYKYCSLVSPAGSLPGCFCPGNLIIVNTPPQIAWPGDLDSEYGG
jgi:hypothetical protein